MKDYTLSQILAHCKKMNTQAAGCESCRDQDPDLYDFCQKEFECFPIRWGERYIIEEQGKRRDAFSCSTDCEYSIT